MTTVYRSRIDAWLAVVLVAGMVMSLSAGIAILADGSPAAWWSLPLAVVAGVALPLWLLLGTHYTLDPERLTIRCGPFRWTVPVSEIRSITPTRNPLSSPALSLDRLRIEYGRGAAIMISPRDKERFMAEVERLRRGSG